VILHTLCNTCFQVYEIRIEPYDKELFEELRSSMGSAQGCKCPRLCGGYILLERSKEAQALAENKLLKAPLSISVTELFGALHGTGLPDEVPNSPEVVEALLLAHQVKKVDVQQEGKRIYLHEIHLSNGSVLHLAAGMRGCQVLKITKEST
jgi:hypothetical protein